MGMNAASFKRLDFRLRHSGMQKTKERAADMYGCTDGGQLLVRSGVIAGYFLGMHGHKRHTYATTTQVGTVLFGSGELIGHPLELYGHAFSHSVLHARIMQ
eukprot:9486816-Pyramimonas_sp.AAC.1